MSIFTEATFKFLEGLAANNDRDWFKAHRRDYEQHYLTPALAFIETAGARLQKLRPSVNYGKDSLMRIHRDVRFSKDKSPYNVYLRLALWDGEGKKTERPAFMFGFDLEEGAVLAGLYGFDKERLERYRRAVASEAGAELEGLVAGHALVGEETKRVPRGFPPDHPRADLLRRKGLAALAPLTRQEITAPDLVDRCLAHWKRMLPLEGWLCQHLYEAAPSTRAGGE